MLKPGPEKMRKFYREQAMEQRERGESMRKGVVLEKKFGSFEDWENSLAEALLGR